MHDEWAVYQTKRGYVAAKYQGSDGCMVIAGNGEAHAEDLAKQFNEEMGEDQVATKKNGGKVKTKKATSAKINDKPRDQRIPSAGTVLRKQYKGKEYEIRVNEMDFTFDGERYKNLSQVTAIITDHKYDPPSGHGLNGYVFFKRELAEKIAEQK